MFRFFFNYEIVVDRRWTRCSNYAGGKIPGTTYRHAILIIPSAPTTLRGRLFHIGPWEMACVIEQAFAPAKSLLSNDAVSPDVITWFDESVSTIQRI